MSQNMQLEPGTIWVCERCDIWWGSQVGQRPSTNFLTKLDDAGLLPSWDAYRGWKLAIEQASTCLECGNSITLPALQSN